MAPWVKGLPSKCENGGLGAITERRAADHCFLLRKQAGEDQRLMLSKDPPRGTLTFAPPPQTQFKCVGNSGAWREEGLEDAPKKVIS